MEELLFEDGMVIRRELAAGGGKRIACLTLNTESTLNSLNREMVDSLLHSLERWRDNPDIICVFIDAVGEKAFCAGGDVHELHASSVGTPGGPCEYAEAFFEQEYRMNYLLHSYPKPILCWGHGIVMGGGLGVLAACSHKVVTPATRMAMPEVTIALFPDVGGSYFLNRMPGESGLFLALTAAPMNAADALFTGVADAFIENEQRGAVLEKLLEESWSGDAAEFPKRVDAILQQFQSEGKTALPIGNVEPNMALINSLCDRSDAVATVTAITSIDTDDRWLSRARSGLAAGSPLAALWTHRQLQISSKLSLAEIFRSELSLATNIMRDAEFGEGVRALLIDKDRNPSWQYSSCAEVPAAKLESFFVEPWSVNPLSDLS